MRAMGHSSSMGRAHVIQPPRDDHIPNVWARPGGPVRRGRSEKVAKVALLMISLGRTPCLRDARRRQMIKISEPMGELT